MLEEILLDNILSLGFSQYLLLVSKLISRPCTATSSSLQRTSLQSSIHLQSKTPLKIASEIPTTVLIHPHLLPSFLQNPSHPSRLFHEMPHNIIHPIPTLLLLPILAFLLRSSSAASAAINPQYADCSKPLRCDNIAVSYPFTLPSSPIYCGVPGYGLDCVGGSNLTINLAGDVYRVMDINYEQGVFTAVDPNFLGSNCPQTFRNTSFNPSLFDLSDLDWILAVYVKCASPVFLPGFQEISCMENLNSYYNLQKGLTSFVLDLLVPCQLTAAVPLYESAAMSLNSSSPDFGGTLRQGFGMKWSAGSDWCRVCIDAGGVCGYNSSRATDPICFCPNQTELGTCPYGKEATGGSSKSGLIIGLSIAGCVSFILLCSICFLLYRRRKKRQQSTFIGRLTTSFSMSSKTDHDPASSLYTHIFSYDELFEATNGFDSSRELGDGGFGTVYKGKLKDGRVVAVKRLHENSYRRQEQFLNEVKIVSLLRHQNLASLYGCTSRHSREHLLVYEFVPNGTIADHLHGSLSSVFLPWDARINIAIETAEALHYLHSVQPQIIHRDIKSTNILLDNSFHVKVADFGLSRLFPLDATHVSTAPQGTPGYLDPEYHKCFQLTDKSDVYSFGVVLMELISSKPAVDVSRGRNEINLAYMAVNKIQNQELHEFVDPRLGYNSDRRIMGMITQVAGLALQCLESEREMRPAIKEVLQVLRGILLQSAATDGNINDVYMVAAEKEEARLLKSINTLPFSPISVTDKWLSSASISGSSV